MEEPAWERHLSLDRRHGNLEFESWRLKTDLVPSKPRVYPLSSNLHPYIPSAPDMDFIRARNAAFYNGLMMQPGGDVYICLASHGDEAMRIYGIETTPELQLRPLFGVSASLSTMFLTTWKRRDEFACVRFVLGMRTGL